MFTSFMNKYINSETELQEGICKSDSCKNNSALKMEYKTLDYAFSVMWSSQTLTRCQY